MNHETMLKQIIYPDDIRFPALAGIRWSASPNLEIRVELRDGGTEAVNPSTCDVGEVGMSPLCSPRSPLAKESCIPTGKLERLGVCGNVGVVDLVLLVGVDTGVRNVAVGDLGVFGDKGTSASSQKEEPALVFGFAELRPRRNLGRFLEDIEFDEGCS